MFKFVSTDVAAKISILKSKMECDPEHYRSVKTMIAHEMETSLTVADPQNGCRTLLRLHRALGEF